MLHLLVPGNACDLRRRACTRCAGTLQATQPLLAVSKSQKQRHNHGGGQCLLQRITQLLEWVHQGPLDPDPAHTNCCQPTQPAGKIHKLLALTVLTIRLLLKGLPAHPP